MDLVEKLNYNTIRHPWELARFQVSLDLLKMQVDHTKPLHILDLGCGDLFFIKKLKSYFPNATFYAVDIAFKDRFIEDNREDNLLLYTNFDQLILPENISLDLVFLMDVIEHIEFEKDFLKSVLSNTVIDKQTKFLITVPAFQSLFCSHDKFLGHYRRYTNDTLAETLDEVGMKKIKMGYFFFSLLMPRALAKTIEKMKGNEKLSEGTGLSYWDKGSFITSVIKNILILDYRITKGLKKIGVNTIGLSNFAICKPQ